MIDILSGFGFLPGSLKDSVISSSVEALCRLSLTHSRLLRYRLGSD